MIAARHIKLGVLTLCCAAAFCPQARGQTGGHLLDRLDKQREEQRADEELRRAQQRDEQSRSRQERRDDKAKGESERKVTFERIEFEREDAMSRRMIEPISERYLGRELGSTDILNILREATNMLVAEGYSTSLVTIAQMRPADRVLVLRIRYGTVGDLIVNGEPNTAAIAMASPLDKGDVFNIYKLDTAVENLRRVSDSAHVAVRAAEQQGVSNLVFEQDVNRFAGRVSLDNSGSRDLGEFKASSMLSFNNPLGLNDTLWLYANVGLLKNMSDNRSNAYAAGYGLPFEEWRFDYTFQLSDSKTFTAGNYSDYSYYAQTYKHVLGLDRIVYRDRLAKVVLRGDITVRENRNRIDDVRLETSSGTFASGALGIEYTDVLLGGYLYLFLEYRRGLGLFGSKTSIPDSPYVPEFDQYSLNLSYQRALVNGSRMTVSLRSNLGASYSPDSLLYDDKFLVGDEYTVRGFKESSAAWDYGVYLNNTLRFHFRTGMKWLDAVEPFVGLDYGWGRDYLLASPDRLWGAAVGFDVRYKALSMSLTASKELHKSEDMPSERLPVYFTLSAAF